MTTAPHGIPTIQSATSQPISTHQYVSAKDRLIGKPRFHFEPTQVMQLLRQRIIGQDAALNEIEKMLYVVKADFSSTERPLSVTLMLGPIGVSNTEGAPDCLSHLWSP